MSVRGCITHETIIMHGYELADGQCRIQRLCSGTGVGRLGKVCSYAALPDQFCQSGHSHHARQSLFGTGWSVQGKTGRSTGFAKTKRDCPLPISHMLRVTEETHSDVARCSAKHGERHVCRDEEDIKAIIGKRSIKHVALEHHSTLLFDAPILGR